MFYPNLTELATSQGYQRFFKVVPALNDALRAENYRIRHEVYCRELGFEPMREDGMETDAFDQQSVHCLVQSATTGAYVGCARLVLVDPERPLAPLPFEVSCKSTLDRSIVDPMHLDRPRIAEISRLAVIGSYRRRHGENSRPISISDADFGSEQQPRQPYLALAVYLAIIALASLYGVATLFVLTEPRLAAILSRGGFSLEQIGGAVEHRGTRLPLMMSVDRTSEEMRLPLRALFSVILEEVRAGVEASGSEAVRARHRPL